jgi:hypothetical protein
MCKDYLSFLVSLVECVCFKNNCLVFDSIKTTYTSMLAALNNYAPSAGAEDELTIKNNQVLLLLDSFNN